MSALVALFLLLLTACASPRVGPGEITHVSPFADHVRCATNCAGCTTDERQAFETTRAERCARPK